MRTFILFLSFSFFSLAHAGGSTAGNGGDVVVCPNVPGQPEYRLLDFYEMEFYDGKKPIFPSAGTPESAVGYILEDIARQSPLRAEAYQDELAQFWKRAVVKDVVPEIRDSGSLILPRGCHIEQVVVQMRQQGIPSYEVNGRLWNKLSLENKAGTLLHEIIYGEAIDAGRQTSAEARDLVRTLLRDEAWKKSRFDFSNIVWEKGFHRWIEAVLGSGEVLLYRPADLANNYAKKIDEELVFKSHYACGAGVATGAWIMRCNPEEKPLYVSLAQERILAVTDSDGRVLYRPDYAMLGLPVPVSEFEPFHSFVPTEDVRIEQPIIKAWCKAGGKVELWRNPWANKTKFDLLNSPLKTCELSQEYGKRNQVRIGDEWFELAKFKINSFGDKGQIDDGRVEFVEDYPFRPYILGEYVRFRAVEYWYDWMIGEPFDAKELPDTFEVEGKKCKLRGKANLALKYIGGQAMHALVMYTKGNSCKTKVNGVVLPLARVGIKYRDDSIGPISVAVDAKMKIRSVDSEGKEVIKEEEVWPNRHLYPVYGQPGVFRYEQKSDEEGEY